CCTSSSTSRRPVRPVRDAESDRGGNARRRCAHPLWWAISFMAGARGNGSGVASAGILGAGWAALTNGFPIVYCPPVCEEAWPLTDLGHVGSIVFGILLALVALWALWRAR